MITACLLVMPVRAALAQPKPEPMAGAQPTPATGRSEAEFLVPPQGGAFEIPVHAGEVCILSFPDKLNSRALSSSATYEIKAWGEDGVAVRAASEKAGTATLAIATASGQIKVNVTLRVVAAGLPALTLVRFKAATAEDAFEAQVKAEVARRVGRLEAELAAARKDLDGQLRDRADGMIAERLLRRNERVALEAHERNDDHVVVHVRRAQLVGEDGYLSFEIENRSKAAYRLATARVLAGDRDLAGPARLASTAIDRDPSVIGVVAAGATARGVVVVRSVDGVLGKSLVLELAGPDGRGKVQVGRGIVLR